MAPTPSAPEPWSEQRLLALEPHEHDYQEFKGSAWAWEQGAARLRGDFLDNLSKQVSAFANAAGGHLFLGLDDQGRIDGGVPRDLRPCGTREWLEDLIPQLVDPHLKACNVYEVPADDETRSAILPGRAVYVLEIPQSDAAPHMARDRRYYLRIAGRSRPMANRHVLDILHRTTHPAVTVERIDPFGEPELIVNDPRGPKAVVRLRAMLVNTGRTLAQHVGCEFVLPRHATDRESRRRTLEGLEGRLLQRPGELVFFFYHPIPIFPTQSVPFGEVWVTVHQANLEQWQQGRLQLRWSVFADAAPRVEGRVELAHFNAVQRATKLVEQALRMSGPPVRETRSGRLPSSSPSSSSSRLPRET